MGKRKMTTTTFFVNFPLSLRAFINHLLFFCFAFACIIVYTDTVTLIFVCVCFSQYSFLISIFDCIVNHALCVP